MPFCFSSGLNNEVSRVRLLTDDAPDAALALPWDAVPTYPYRVSVSASLEPDLDHDGYGDETQDGCTMDATTHGSCATAGGGAPTPVPDPGTAPSLMASERIAPTSFTLAGHFTLAGRPGANRFAFTGRIGGIRLKPGSYRLVGAPTANGHRGRPVSASFRIVK